MPHSRLWLVTAYTKPTNGENEIVEMDHLEDFAHHADILYITEHDNGSISGLVRTHSAAAAIAGLEHAIDKLASRAGDLSKKITGVTAYKNTHPHTNKESTYITHHGIMEMSGSGSSFGKDLTTVADFPHNYVGTKCGKIWSTNEVVTWMTDHGHPIREHS